PGRPPAKAGQPGPPHRRPHQGRPAAPRFPGRFPAGRRQRSAVIRGPGRPRSVHRDHPDADLGSLRRGGQAVVTPAPGPGSDPRLGALTTLAGWRQFASEMPAVPQLLDGTVWQGLDRDKRAAYDDDRIAHHSRLLIVQTPAVRDVVTTGRRLAHLN